MTPALAGLRVMEANDYARLEAQLDNLPSDRIEAAIMRASIYADLALTPKGDLDAIRRLLNRPEALVGGGA
jgi:hypothetical protein